MRPDHNPRVYERLSLSVKNRGTIRCRPRAHLAAFRLDSFRDARHTFASDVEGIQSTENPCLRPPVIMPPQPEASPIPDDRLKVEKRTDGAIVVRVRSEGPEESRLPDAVFSFRNGDPQYAYWLARLASPPADSR